MMNGYSSLRQQATRSAVVPTVREHVSLRDLPAMPKVMNVIGVVLMYTSYGLSDEDICAVCNIDEERLTRVRENPAYGAVQRAMYNAAVQSDADPVSLALREAATTAVDAVKSSLSSQSEWIRLAAAKDVLDRGGYVPRNVVLHQHQHSGGMRIEYVDKTDKMDDTTITLEAMND